MSRFRIKSSIEFGTSEDRDFYVSDEPNYRSGATMETVSNSGGLAQQESHFLFNSLVEAESYFSGVAAFLIYPDLMPIGTVPLGEVVSNPESVLGFVSIHECFHSSGEPQSAWLNCKDHPSCNYREVAV